MLETLLLDSLLILILLLLIPIGMYRGGLREVCSAAGVLFGLLVAQQWSARWGDWIADVSGIDIGVSRFVAAVATIVLFAGVIGYGAAASFSYSPGPGGRVYGGLISLASGVVFIGALIEFVATYLYDGVYPDLIRDGYVSRALSQGFEWVLLCVAVAVLGATLFGMIVRERDTQDIVVEIPRDVTTTARRPAPVPAMAPEPVNLEPASERQAEPETVAGTAAVKIREVRHWEETTPPTMQDLKSGWSRTWPSSVARDTSDAGWKGAQPRPSRPVPPTRRPQESQDEAVIRDWLAEDQRPPRSGPQPRRPIEDE